MSVELSDSSVQSSSQLTVRHSSVHAVPRRSLCWRVNTSPHQCAPWTMPHAGACLWPEPVSVCAQPSAGAGYPLARGRRLAAPLEPESRSGRTEEINFTRTYLAITLRFTASRTASARARQTGVVYSIHTKLVPRQRDVHSNAFRFRPCASTGVLLPLSQSLDSLPQCPEMQRHV